jgi:hypothetical protein
MNWPTSLTSTPAPRAMRRRRGPSSESGFYRSYMFIESKIAFI